MCCFLTHRSHSISFTRAQGISKYKIGFVAYTENPNSCPAPKPTNLALLLGASCLPQLLQSSLNGCDDVQIEHVIGSLGQLLGGARCRGHQHGAVDNKPMGQTLLKGTPLHCGLKQHGETTMRSTDRLACRRLNTHHASGPIITKDGMGDGDRGGGGGQARGLGGVVWVLLLGFNAGYKPHIRD